MWIWLIGGLAVALLTVGAAYSAITQASCQADRQGTINQFKTLNDRINFVCEQAIGTRHTMQMDLGCGVHGIYANERPGEHIVDGSNEHGRLPALIANREYNTGKHVCLAFQDSLYQCVEHSCAVNLTYMGEPAEGSSMYRFGQDDNQFSFKVKVQKAESEDTADYVKVGASHLP
jgi:hypothetical protein